MQNKTTSIAVLVAAGMVVAVAVTWLLGVFPAVAISPEFARTLRGSPLQAALYYGFAMNVAPALALGVVAGFALKAITGGTVKQVALFVALPWLAYATLGLVLAPYPPEVGLLARLRPFLSWQLWLPVLSVPLGLWVGASLQASIPWRKQGRQSAA